MYILPIESVVVNSELQLSVPSLILSASLSVCLSISVTSSNSREEERGYGELRRWNKRHVLRVLGKSWLCQSPAKEPCKNIHPRPDTHAHLDVCGCVYA